MKKTRVILQVAVDVEHEDHADLDYVISEIDYNFSSERDDATVVDTEIREILNTVEI